MSKYFLVFMIGIPLLIFSCQKGAVNQKNLSEVDDLYDSEFPQTPVSEELEEIIESLHLISILSFYRSYHFTEDMEIFKKDLAANNLKDQAIESVVFEQPASGTATLIYLDRSKIVFLTCAHIVNFPDTIMTYFKDAAGLDTESIQSLVIKVRQTNNIINQPIAYNFEILAMDEEQDLALIGKDFSQMGTFGFTDKLDNSALSSLKVFNRTLGKSKELQWGTFVYLAGFPQAKKMVSTAIVSNPDYDNNYSFILDATLQKGISGGIVLALRDGPPNFELVGIATGISGKSEFQIVPENNIPLSEWDLYKPYSGDLYLRKKDIPAPGMIFATGIENILSFIRDNELKLREKGYNPDRFFQRSHQ